jgi:hypothetical protein
MHLALDYDDTYTRDPNFWDVFIRSALEVGHRVSIVTFRDERHDWTPSLGWLRDEIQIPVICTRGVAKGFYCDNFHEHVDVWIDDRPAGILHNSSLSPEGLAEWRAANAAAAAEVERPAV